MKKEKFKLPAAVYLMLIKDGQVLLLRRFNTGWKDGMYSLIAGHLDGNETTTEAMIREAKEEGGIIVEPSDLAVVHTMHRKSVDDEYIDFFFIAKKWSGEPKIMEPEKCDELAWYPVDHLPLNTLPYIGEVIAHYMNGVTYSESGWETPTHA